MKAQAVFTLMFVLLVSTLSFSTPQGVAGSSSSGGDYEISLNGDGVQVSVSTIMNQNVTQVPVYSVGLLNENASSLSDYLNKSVQMLTPNARVEGVVLRSDSNGTLTRINLQFKVVGAGFTDRWGASQMDLAWRGFKVDDDILVGGVSVNLVGKHYLSSPLLDLVNASFHPLQGIRITFQLNGQIATALEVQQMAPTINLLDFSRLRTPLISWVRNSSVLSPAAIWTKDSGFQLLGIETIKEPLGEEIKLSSNISYKYQAVLQVPSFHNFQQDRVIYGASILESIMTGIILAVLGLAVGTYTLDRRLTSKRKSRPKKGKA